jgi:predicted DNA-binding protein (MmcQ/YjbR family)
VAEPGARAAAAARAGKAPTRRRDPRPRLAAFARTLPESYEDHPWGELVVKVNKKIFVFLGSDGSATPSMAVKLVDSHVQALAVPGAAPSGYGLGKAGWVTVGVGSSAVPVGVLEDWIEESYRLVAPKRLVRLLDEGPGPLG